MKLNPWNLRKKTLENVLVRMFESIPQALQQITPEGFDNSPYYFIYNHTVEYEYRTYRRMRAWEYSRDKKSGSAEIRRPDLEKFDDFKKNYVYPPADVNIEMAQILCEALDSISIGGLFIHGKANKMYQMNGMSDYSDLLDLAAKKAGLIEDRENSFFHLRSFDAFHSELEPPLFNFVFGILKACGIGWYHHCPGLAFFIRLEEENEQDDETPHDRYDPEMSCLNELSRNGHFDEDEDEDEARSDCDERGMRIVSVEDAFEKAQKEIPSDMVIAYFDVYGKWPEGYPPKLEDYT